MVLGLIGNIAGNLNQDKFVEGAEAENRLQALQRANFTRDQERFGLQNLKKPTLPTATDITQGSAGLSLDGFGGNYITVDPPKEKKAPEVVIPEAQTIIPPGDATEESTVGDDQIVIDETETASSALSVPDFDPNKELDFSGIGTGNTPDIRQLDEKSSKFMKDIDTLFARGDFAKIMSKIKVRAATGYGDALAGSPWGNFLGYFTDSPEQAKERSISTEASDWFQSKEALNYFLQNKDQLKTAAIDPTGWYKKFKEDAPKREELQINRESSGKADKRVSTLTTDDALTKAFSNKKVQEVRNVASAIGLNPDFAMAIMGMESSFGTAKNLTSTKGAKGIMQVMPDTFDQMKAWYTNPANIKKYNIPQEVVNLASAMQKGNMQSPAAGLLYLKYGQYIGVPMNLLAAGYQGGMESVLQRGTPTTANDGSLTNTDYNRAVIGIYNSILQKTGGTTITTTNNKPFQDTSGTTNNTTTTTTTEKPVAGLVTDVQTDKSGQSTNTSNTAQSSTDVSSLAEVSQGVGVDDGTKKAPENNVPESKTEVKPPAFYTKDPSAVGFELRNFLEERELIINQTNANVKYQNELADYYRRFSEIMNTGGTDLARAKQLSELATNAEIAATDTRTKGMLEAKKSENKIMYLQGMQALSDLTKGSVDRAAMVWSQYSGLDIRINPRSDGKYDVTVGGKPYKTMDQKQLSNTLRLAFDQGYRGSQADLAGKMAMKEFDTQLEIMKQQYKDLGENYRKRLEAQYKMLEKKYETDNKVTVSNTGDGGVIIQEGRQTYMLVEQKSTGPNGEDVYSYIKQPVTTPSGTNNYKRDKKD
mgnify:CR=1 FL=1|tara:strand:+ start:577 stop:3030 length:2454 start_codon:yes stop_codon:yes gene_type:complete